MRIKFFAIAFLISNATLGQTTSEKDYYEIANLVLQEDRASLVLEKPNNTDIIDATDSLRIIEDITDTTPYIVFTEAERKFFLKQIVAASDRKWDSEKLKVKTTRRTLINEIISAAQSSSSGIEVPTRYSRFFNSTVSESRSSLPIFTEDLKTAFISVFNEWITLRGNELIIGDLHLIIYVCKKVDDKWVISARKLIEIS